MKLTSKQKEKLDLIINEYELSKEGVYFKAPTGSGKTFIISSFIDEVLKRKLSDEKIIFIIGTLSSSELPLQMKTKLDEYNEIQTHKVDNIFIDSPSKKNKITEQDVCNVFKIPFDSQNLVYIFGASSFTKSSLFYQNKCFDNFLLELKNNNFKIIYIRDEAHIGSKNRENDSKKNWTNGNNASLDYLLSNDASFTLKLTATPNLDNLKQISLTEIELEEDEKKLLKKEPPKRFTNINNDVDDDELLQNAIEEYKQIQEKYASDKDLSELNINPAMIIQVSSNKNYNYDKNTNFRNDIDNIKKILTKNKIKWVLYFGDRKEQSEDILKRKIKLSEISKGNSEIEAIIIKIGPAIGWDIPRACMLIQLRNVFSETLNIQTIGRVKRNALPTLKDNKLARTYWLYSNYQGSRTDMTTYKLKEEYESNKKENILFYSGKLNITEEINNKVFSEIYENFESYMNRELEIIEIIKSFKNDFFNESEEWNKMFIETLINSDTKVKSKHFIWVKSYFDLFKIIYEFQFENDLNMCIKKFYDEEKISSYIDLIQFKYILIKLNNVINNLREFNSKIIKKNITHENYILDIENEKQLPIEFNVWKRKQEKNIDKEVIIKDIKNFFPYRNQEKIEKYRLYTDSYNESGIIENFTKLLKKGIDKKSDKIENLNLFSINPALSSKINFEYLNYKNEKKKSFPDWVVKYKGKNLYMEFKSENEDYDSEKTKNLAEAYRNYSKNNENNLFAIAYGIKSKSIKNRIYEEWNMNRIIIYKNGDSKEINALKSSFLKELANYIESN